jgi:hypothetical protein
MGLAEQPRCSDALFAAQIPVLIFPSYRLSDVIPHRFTSQSGCSMGIGCTANVLQHPD